MAWYGMPFTHDVDQLSELTPSTGFSAVTDAIDPLWIAEALEATGTRTIRRRKLPAEMVIWLVIAMALFLSLLKIHPPARSGTWGTRCLLEISAACREDPE